MESFYKAEQLNPTYVYTWYRIYLLRSELGEQKVAQQELKDRMKSFTDSKKPDWSLNVGNFLAGNFSEEQFIQIAKDSARNRFEQQEQLCEANYYVGMEHLLSGHPAEAVNFFRQCLATSEKDFREYVSANAELNVLTIR